MKTKIFLFLIMALLSTTIFAQRTTIYPTLTAGLTINDQNPTGYAYYAIGAVVTTEPATYTPFPYDYNPISAPATITFYSSNPYNVGVPKPAPISKNFYTIRILVIKVDAGTTNEVARRYGTSVAGLDASDNLYAINGISVSF